ncbi:hypothetical protein E2C01_043148 [Portunus trituberculatus]|uniref:Uncharacterized protein n=1 Tax=Portunus trituberculatus TaxID=210409 RepID=A0A5B7FVJ1_PORTR|nr:hypothetical protein [Portunus trituberculatus]
MQIGGGGGGGGGGERVVGTVHVAQHSLTPTPASDVDPRTTTTATTTTTTTCCHHRPSTLFLPPSQAMIGVDGEECWECKDGWMKVE